MNEELKARPFLAMFKKVGSNPDPTMTDGWFSISIEARSEEEAERWATHRAEKLSEWFKHELEFVRAEPHKPRREYAGPYRGLIVSVD